MAARVAASVRGGADLRFGSRQRNLEAIQPAKHGEGFIRGRTALNRGLQQAAGFVSFAALERRDAVVQEFFGLALPLGERAASPLDVGAGAGVVAIEKQRARPDVDRGFVARREIMIETNEQQVLDFGVAIRLRRRHVVADIVALDLGHECAGDYNPERFSVQAFMPLIECIPNISEGRRPEIVARLVNAISSTPGVRLLDHSSDPAHNRSVFTLVGDGTAVEAAVLALFKAALAEVDLRTHQGEHPRLGAVDVVPFVPIEGVTMADCVALARKVGAAVAERFGVPIYLYEEASSNPARKNLEDIRRGEFEGLAAKMQSDGWKPDFGPSTPHPSAGASVIGARMALIAYNINLATDRIDVAKRIAAGIRHSSGGYRYVKAAGFKLDDRGIVQVSMNLTNYEKTPIFRVFETVKREAARYGVQVLESEIVGLIPSAALLSAAQFYLQLERFNTDQVLEFKLRR
jgi:glutamate formiminotransferase / 5-formyltetrahydrofolate cyclo-ligase